MFVSDMTELTGLRDRDRETLPACRIRSLDARLLSGLWSLLAVLLA